MATLRVPDVVPTPQQDCERLHKAFNKGLGTDEESVDWVLGHRDLFQRDIIVAYVQTSHKAIIMWTTDPPERDAKMILLGFVSSYRYDKETVHIGLAKSEADKLNQAIKAKQFDHDDSVFVLSTRNFYQLRATFQCYQQNYGNFIDEDIKSGGDDELGALLKVAIHCIDVPERPRRGHKKFACRDRDRQMKRHGLGL